MTRDRAGSGLKTPGFGILVGEKYYLYFYDKTTFL
jgi:hypothetical protein